MDDRSFDALVKILAAPRSRRRLLRAVTGAALAAAAADRAVPALAAGGICDPKLAATCARDATSFYQTQQAECRGLLRSDPTDPAHSAQVMFSCLAGAQVEYSRELAQCTYQPCDQSSCETCVNGSCQSTCAAGVSCVGGQCAGCPGDQHKCGSACCASGQVCCNQTCCPSNVTACDPTTGGCLTCSVQNCASGCCDSQGVCQPGTDAGACGSGGNACAVCGSNDVCQGQTCQTQSCLASGQTCGSDTPCCSGSCVANVCCQPEGTSCTGGCCSGLTCDSSTNTCQSAACGSCTHWDDCPAGGTCSSCFLGAPPPATCSTVVCGGVTCPKPTVANHRAVCCNGQCDLACFATVGFDAQGNPQCCEGYNVFGGPPECQQTVPCQGSAAACNGTCSS